MNDMAKKKTAKKTRSKAAKKSKRAPKKVKRAAAPATKSARIVVAQLVERCKRRFDALFAADPRRNIQALVYAELSPGEVKRVRPALRAHAKLRRNA